MHYGQKLGGKYDGALKKMHNCII